MMKPLIDTLTEAWPGILLVAAIIGGVIAWVATRTTRRAMQAGQDQLIHVYNERIAAQEGLAKTIAESSSKQIEILTKERADSDARHETVIAEYRARTNSLRDELQACTVRAGEFQVKLADLTARTDFRPVLDFQKVWYEETKEINKMTLSTMQAIMPVLQEVTEALRYFGKNVQEVRVTNTEADRVPVVGAEPPATMPTAPVAPR